jgi:hypothetical protein
MGNTVALSNVMMVNSRRKIVAESDTQRFNTPVMSKIPITTSTTARAIAM